MGLVPWVALFLAVWLATFAALASPIHAYHLKQNEYADVLAKLFEGALELDEKLISVTALTLWSVGWCVVVDAIRQPKPALGLPACLIIAAFASFVVGHNFRQLFRSPMDSVFHVVFSLGAIAIFLLIGACHFRQRGRKSN